MNATTAVPDDCPRLLEALYPLAAAPSGPGWNHNELTDLLPPSVRQVEAAVLVGLVPRADGTRVLLTRRTDALRHHAGQVSFPGGRIEPGDRDAVAAALRETSEEIGIPAARIEPLGFLDPLATISGFRVLPVVALVDADYLASPDPSEVAEVFEVPLDYLLDPANLGRRALDPGRPSGAAAPGRRPREVLEYRYPTQRIWGATASMLLNLRQRLEDLQ